MYKKKIYKKYIYLLNIYIYIYAHSFWNTILDTFIQHWPLHGPWDFTRATFHGNFQVQGRRLDEAPSSSTGLYSLQRPVRTHHCGPTAWPSDIAPCLLDCIMSVHPSSTPLAWARWHAGTRPPPQFTGTWAHGRTGKDHQRTLLTALVTHLPNRSIFCFLQHAGRKVQPLKAIQIEFHRRVFALMFSRRITPGEPINFRCPFELQDHRIPSGNQTWQLEIPSKWRFDWVNHNLSSIYVYMYIYIYVKKRWFSLAMFND